MGSRMSLNPNSEIETADSADFTDFEGVIGDVRIFLRQNFRAFIIVTYCIRVICNAKVQNLVFLAKFSRGYLSKLFNISIAGS